MAAVLNESIHLDINIVTALLQEICENVVLKLQINNDLSADGRPHFKDFNVCEVETQYFGIINEVTTAVDNQNEHISDFTGSTSAPSVEMPMVIYDISDSILTCSNEKNSMDTGTGNSVISVISETDLSNSDGNITKIDQSSAASISTCLSGSCSVQDSDETNKNSSDLRNSLIISESIGHQLIGESKNFEHGNFFRGCKWAPDGLCFLTNTNDNFVRIFNSPRECFAKNIEEINSSVVLEDCLKVKEPGLVYDYCWWPLMNSQDPSTCCFATTALNQPVHLWDAFTGALRASYIAHNSVHELASAHSLCFSHDGRQLICGYKKDVCLFYTDRPGAHYERWSTMKKKQKKSQNNIISCAEFSPDNSMFACGCYDGTIGLYSPVNGHLLDFSAAHRNGITCLKFSKDGYRLYTGVRNADSIKCWDIRNIRTPIFTIKRSVSTNQRMYFDLMCDSNDDIELSLISGSTDGYVSFWKIGDVIDETNETIYWETKELEKAYTFKAHNDCTNGCSFHPYLPLVATSSGQRWFSDVCDSDDENCDFLLRKSDQGENKTKLWYFSGQKSTQMIDAQ